MADQSGAGMKPIGDVIEQPLYRPRTSTYRSSHDSLARGLGWFSLALGFTEILFSRPLARALGMRGREHLVMLYGAREIATGIGLLAAAHRTPWVWGRVASDAADAVTLVGHMRPGHRLGPALGLAAVAAASIVDIASASALAARDRRHARPRVRGAALKEFETPRVMRASMHAPVDIEL